MTEQQPYQVMPPLADAEYEALRASIAAGYDPAQPIVTDEHGTVLDGHHRLRACAELGTTPPSVILPGLTEDQKRDYALRANLARRHLTSAQKRELIAAEMERDPGRSDREIGRLCGADHKTVGSVRRELAGEIPHPELSAAQRKQADLLFALMRERSLSVLRRIDTGEPICGWTVQRGEECDDLAVVGAASMRYWEWMYTSEETRGLVWEYADADDEAGAA